MIQPHIAAESGILLAQLADAAARSLALAAVAGLALAIFRVKATSARLFTWSTVLYAALAIPLLGWVLPSLPIPMPSLLQSTARHLPGEAVTSDVDAVSNAGQWSGNTVRNVQPPEESSLEKHPAVSGSTILVQHPQPHSAVPISWRTAASVVYLLVALCLMVRLAIGIGLTQRLVKTSEHINDPRLRSKLAYCSSANALSFLTEVRASTAISVPVTVGPIRSTILLPASWREWDEEKLDAVIAHEMSHVSRYDALTQCVALLHRAIFWFSPLSWWLNRHIADLAEQASDEAALCGGADRTHYARTLLQFFETLHAKPRRVWWQGVSLANSGQAEKRLEKILGWRGAVTMNLKKSAAAVILALAVPVIFLAASAQPTSHSTITSSSQEPPGPPADAQAVPAQPAPPPAEGVIIAPMPGVPGHRAISGVPAPAAPIAGIPAVPAMPASPVTPVQPGVAGIGHKHGFHYSYDFDDEERFVIVSANSDSVTMSGSSQDVRHAQKLKKQIPGDFIWFQRDEKSYIIRDPATVDRARKLWAPQEELGKKQEELGKQQEALGKQQEELGARMEKVQVKVPDLTAQVDKLRAELKSLSSGATQEQIGKLQSEIGELQSQLGEVQSHAGDQQGKLGEEMGALGEKQGKLGEQQGELGRQQAELAEKATKEMKQILDEAIKNGTAKPEPGETDGESL